MLHNTDRRMLSPQFAEAAMFPILPKRRGSRAAEYLQKESIMGPDVVVTIDTDAQFAVLSLHDGEEGEEHIPLDKKGRYIGRTTLRDAARILVEFDAKECVNTEDNSNEDRNK